MTPQKKRNNQVLGVFKHICAPKTNGSTSIMDFSSFEAHNGPKIVFLSKMAAQGP